MLDDVAVGPFLEQPARKDAVPFVVALFLHRQLDKGAGFGRRFPWRGLFASAQSDHRAAYPGAVAGAHFQIANQAIALVQQRNDRHPVGHRRRAFDPAALLRHRPRSSDFGFNLGRRRRISGAVAASQQQRRHQSSAKCSNRAARHHSAPGCQAS
jgi:hypothetical protein